MTSITRPKILVIDDDASIRSLVKLHLVNAGYDVIEAADGVDGGYLILEAAPDLIVCDVNMPYMNGYEFVAALRGDPQTQHIPVVFLTVQDDFANQAKKLGAAAYLAKPLMADRLLEVVALFAGPGVPTEVRLSGAVLQLSDASASVRDSGRAPLDLGAPRLRVVVADDDRDAASMLSVLLQHEGHRVRCVYRGDAVFSEVCHFQPDAVLLDIGMPGLTGLDTARGLRAYLGRACPLLIAITGRNREADKLAAKTAGFSHYVTKPYCPEELLALLRPLTVSGRPLSQAVS
jgi:CheY-like chemotaxis protein